jgi:hypothetical protein
MKTIDIRPISTVQRINPARIMPASALPDDLLAREYERLATEVRSLAAENAELRRALGY